MGKTTVCSLLVGATLALSTHSVMAAGADIILVGGKIVTVDPRETTAEALAIGGDRIEAVGSTSAIRALAGANTVVIDLQGRTVIPGLIDNHIHAIRDGRLYTRRIDWAGVASIKQALATLHAAAKTSEPGRWLIVDGAWDKNQFAEKRIPTPEELESAAPDNPVYIQHQWQTAVLNRMALRMLGITSATLPPALAGAPGQPVKIEVDANNVPTGVLEANSNGPALDALISPKEQPATLEEAVASTRTYFTILNSLGLTGFVDQGAAGGASDYAVYEPLFRIWRQGELTIRVRYNLYVIPNDAGLDRADPDGILHRAQTLLQFLPPRFGDPWLRFNGFGEVIDTGFFDGGFNGQPIQVTRATLDRGLRYAKWAASKGYSISEHVSYDATVRDLLDIFEEVNRTTPIAGLRWRIEHAEGITDDSLRRMKALGMELSVQDRMYYAGDKFIRLRGQDAANRAPPIMTALRLGIPVSAGTDGAQVSPYNPFVTLFWLVSGATSSGQITRSPAERPSRIEALRMHTLNSARVTFEEHDRGSLETGKLADLVVLDRDYMTVPIDDIRSIHPLMTMVGGKVVYAQGAYAKYR